MPLRYSIDFYIHNDTLKQVPNDATFVIRNYGYVKKKLF